VDKGSINLVLDVCRKMVIDKHYIQDSEAQVNQEDLMDKCLTGDAEERMVQFIPM
jgi:hypothetical protein